MERIHSIMYSTKKSTDFCKKSQKDVGRKEKKVKCGVKTHIFFFTFFFFVLPPRGQHVLGISHKIINVKMEKSAVWTFLVFWWPKKNYFS